jgi:Transposase, Mutator family
MTATPSIDLSSWMTEQLSQASPDLLRQLVQTFAEALMAADADAVCGASYGQRSLDGSNTRNGYRHRSWDTAGSIDLAVPKLREGSCFQSGCWSGAGGPSQLVSVVATSYRSLRSHPLPFSPACLRFPMNSWSMTIAPVRIGAPASIRYLVTCFWVEAGG